uniref:Uncharacterized protein n=1 Tax=Micrurus lemniscatus lemniscatus TaxID=129467 RepID=A0A2D4J0Z4_MICLE
MNSLLNSASGLVSNTRIHPEVGTSYQVGTMFEVTSLSGKPGHKPHSLLSCADAVDPLLASASSPGSVSPLSVHTPADLHPSKQLSGTYVHLLAPDPLQTQPQGQSP